MFWESPDVWVTSTLGVNQPVPGQANTVFARVSNLGLQDAVGVFVEFYWVDPSLAINLANANLIGIGSVDVTAGSAAVATCPTPWVPVIENGGHECLIAEAFLPASDPLTAPLDPVDDRHVGQKNEQLVLAQPGQHMKVRLKAANIAGFAQALTIERPGPATDANPGTAVGAQHRPRAGADARAGRAAAVAGHGGTHPHVLRSQRHLRAPPTFHDAAGSCGHRAGVGTAGADQPSRIVRSVRDAAAATACPAARRISFAPG